MTYLCDAWLEATATGTSWQRLLRVVVVDVSSDALGAMVVIACGASVHMERDSNCQPGPAHSSRAEGRNP